jgi:DNA-binding response OmpR family regulator
VNDQFSRARLLLVDDDVDFSADIASVLSAHCEVELAHTGDQGLSVVKNACPDVVLLDLDFGQGMQRHGLDILEQIREVDDPPAVIMLTGKKTSVQWSKRSRPGPSTISASHPIQASCST